VLTPSTFKDNSFEAKSSCFQSLYGSIHSKGSQYNCSLCLKLHLYYFEKSLLIWIICPSFEILFVCLWSWNPMNLESFHYVIKILCHTQSVERILKFERVFYYSNIRQMLSNLLWALIYFIRRATRVYIFKCICIESFEYMLLILILNVLNNKKRFKICNHGLKQKCTFDYNLGLHAIFNFFVIIWVMIGFNIDIRSQKLHLKYNFGI
jgi:hypothetical protein